jgi:hypothetical protein
VRELQGGTSSVAFSYRIVAKRKDIKRHARFAKIDVPVLLPTRERTRSTRKQGCCAIRNSRPFRRTQAKRRATSPLPQQVVAVRITYAYRFWLGGTAR